MELYYLSSAGKKIDLNSENIFPDNPEKLLEVEFAYETTSSYASTAKLSSVYKKTKEYSLELHVTAESEKNFNILINALDEAFDSDLQAMSAGKLYWGDYYRECFVVKRTPAEYCEWAEWTDMTLTILSLNPDWTQETTYHIKKVADSSNGIQTPVKTPFKLPIKRKNTSINISGYNSCDFVMKVFGPASGVNIQIGDNHYIVDTEVPEGAYLTIDSRKSADIMRRCFITGNYGNTTNVFNSRRSGYSISAKIQTGVNRIIYDGSYSFDLTIYKRGSSPQWI